MKFRPLNFLTAFCAVSLASAQAGTSLSHKEVAPVITPFDEGRLELQVVSGAFFAIGHEKQPSINDAPTSVRFGVMLNTPAGESCLRGNFELMLQLTGSPIFEGPGDYLCGAAAILRYNFVQPDAKCVPYFQIGAGAIYNDIWEDQSQGMIGQPWEISLEAALGVRYLLNDAWSVSVEGGFRHISNADMADRNIGLNSIGGMLGVSYHF